MKYIKTNYTITSVERKEDIKLFERTGQKITNTIEELCDEFVFIVGEGKLIVNNFTQAKKCYNFGKKENATFSLFGAIWTDKGLIYVAKMNDKGELELL